MNYTLNMGLNMPDENDKFSIDHFNANIQALDIVGKPDEYKTTKTYTVGDLCILNDILYKCIVAVESAEEFDAEKWEVTSLCKEEIANRTAINELTEKIPSHILLWENSNPSQSMAANTVIELASDDYEWLEIYYKTSTTSSTTCYQKIRKGDSANLASTMFPSSDTAYGNRALTYVDDTHYKSGTSWISWRSSGINASAAAYTIPLAIYGIK